MDMYGYAPRRRRSARLIIIWVSIFLLMLFMTWYYNSGRVERTRIRMQQEWEAVRS